MLGLYSSALSRHYRTMTMACSRYRLTGMLLTLDKHFFFLFEFYKCILCNIVLRLLLVVYISDLSEQNVQRKKMLIQARMLFDPKFSNIRVFSRFVQT